MVADQLAKAHTVRSDAEERMAEKRAAWKDKNVPAWTKNVTFLWDYSGRKTFLRVSQVPVASNPMISFTDFQRTHVHVCFRCIHFSCSCILLTRQVHVLNVSVSLVDG